MKFSFELYVLPYMLPMCYPYVRPYVLHKVLLKVFPEVLPKPTEISMLKSHWLAPYYPIPNAKFPPITAFLNRSSYHKSAKGSPPFCPQTLWAPQINK